MRRGSPRYLAWGAPRTGKYPPDSMGECALSVTVETLSSSFVEIMSRFVRKDALALADAAVPGVDGTLAGFSSTAPAAPRPVRAVSLGRARLALPSAMARALAASSRVPRRTRGAVPVPAGARARRAGSRSGVARVPKT